MILVFRSFFKTGRDKRANSISGICSGVNISFCYGTRHDFDIGRSILILPKKCRTNGEPPLKKRQRTLKDNQTTNTKAIFPVSLAKTLSTKSSFNQCIRSINWFHSAHFYSWATATWARIIIFLSLSLLTLAAHSWMKVHPSGKVAAVMNFKSDSLYILRVRILHHAVSCKLNRAFNHSLFLKLFFLKELPICLQSFGPIVQSCNRLAS